MSVTIAPVVRIELLPSGIVEFLQTRTGPVLTSTRKTTELRRGMGNATPGIGVNDLWFSWENASEADVIFSVQHLEQIVTPGPVIQSYTPIDSNDSAGLAARVDEVYTYLINYVFRGCCDDGTPIPGPYICKTYAEWDVIRLAGELPEGLWVCVTDIPSQPSATFALFCKEVDQFALGGFGTFLNADWQNNGDYSGVFAITGVAPGVNAGQWYAGMETTTIVYTNLVSGPFLPGMLILDSVTGATALIITDDGVDTMTVVITSVGLTFDPTDSFTNGTVTADVVSVTSQSIFNGDVVIYNCLHYQVVDAAAFAGTDPATNTTAYTLLPKATANTGYISEVDDIEFDFPNDWLQLRSDKRGNRLFYNYFDWNGYGFTALNLFKWGNDNWVNNNVYNGVINEINSTFFEISGNSLGEQSIISNNTGTGSINGNVLGAASYIQSCSIDGGLGSNTFNNNAGLQNKGILVGDLFGYNTISIGQTFSESFASSIQYTSHVGGNSNQTRDLDITGGGSINISANAERVGIYNLTSGNSTETINNFVSPTWPTLFPFTLKPAAGLIVTINFTSVGSLSGNGQVVDGSSFIVLDGDNGDSATFETATIGGFNVVKLVEVIQNT